MRARDYILIFQSDELILKGYIDSDFWFDKDPSQSTSCFVFTIGSMVVSWRNVNQSCIPNSNIEV